VPRFTSFRPAAFALKCFGVYVGVVALSLIVAHVLLVVWPESRWAGRVVAPAARGLEFIDAHWKAILVLVAPFVVPVVAPFARQIAPRVRKLGPIELSEVPLEAEGPPKERVTQSPRGE
jgi:hypothetical protein